MISKRYKRLRTGAGSGIALAKVLTGLGRAPLFVSWNLTFRCNLRCGYCGASEAPRRECTTEEVCAGLQELYGVGARWVTFGGGEPLLRRDLGTLVARAKALGFQVFVSTNGHFLPERLEDLRAVDNLNFSLDGPREVHDAVRGAGAFDDTLRAAAAAREAGLPFSFQYVLARHNLGHVEEALAIAREQGAWMMFQPATQWLDSSTAPNPLAPPVREYREAVDRLAALKRAGAPVANSQAGLRHLAHWPAAAPIRCLAGRLMITVEPDGTLLSCHQYEVGRFLGAEGGSAGSLVDQFRQTPPPRGCVQCWCAPVVELALICSFKPEAIVNTLRRFLR